MGQSVSLFPEEVKNDNPHSHNTDSCFYVDNPRHQKLRETLKRQDKDIQEDVNAFYRNISEENNNLRRQIDKLQRENGDLKKKQRQAAPMQNMDQVIQECLNEQQRLQTENEKLNKENTKLKTENQVLHTEKENALSRLSKIAGIQLTKGNSGIADLSDTNRPTQLAEKWSSLYTDEWSEAFDDLTMRRTINNKDCAAEKELCKIAKEIYQECKTISNKQMTEIKGHAWDIACRLHQQPDQLLEAKQTTLYYKMNKEGDDKKAATTAQRSPCLKMDNIGNRIQAIHKCMDELLQIVHERRKYDETLKCHVIQDILKKFDKYNNPKYNGGVIKFVKRCTELCWSMAIKEPMMCLVYDNLEDTTVDKNMFTLYTVKGSVIDFVVWPALLLHEKGSLLSKGTVQCKQPVSQTDDKDKATPTQDKIHGSHSQDKTQVDPLFKDNVPITPKQYQVPDIANQNEETITSKEHKEQYHPTTGNVTMVQSVKIQSSKTANCNALTRSVGAVPTNNSNPAFSENVKWGKENSGETPTKAASPATSQKQESPTSNEASDKINNRTSVKANSCQGEKYFPPEQN